MHIRWYGQSAFLLTAGGVRVAIDPFGSMASLASRGIDWSYPPIEGLEADLLLVTHEHGDHNAVDVVAGEPEVIRSTAGTFESPVGEVVAIASEHDDAAGTKRGPNTIFVFELDGLRVCHLGDYGQSALRAEQRAAIGRVDVLFLPVGAGPTIGGTASAELTALLQPRLVVPMHYRTPAIGFLEPPDAYLDAAAGRVERLDSAACETGALLGGDAPVVALLAPPHV